MSVYLCCNMYTNYAECWENGNKNKLFQQLLTWILFYKYDKKNMRQMYYSQCWNKKNILKSHVKNIDIKFNSSSN